MIKYLVLFFSLFALASDAEIIKNLHFLEHLEELEDDESFDAIVDAVELEENGKDKNE